MSTTISPLDRRYLQAAIRFARNHEGQTGTNPSVACILVKDGMVIGRGITAKGGRPHAEPVALAEAGDAAVGSTAYVTLEPCAHHGRTPPCAQTLIDAGVSRVIGACTDPDSRVSGKGYQMLLDAGTDVSENVDGVAAARGLEAYLKKRRTNKPFVTLKLAVSKDGFIGEEGSGQFAITGPVARGQSHLMRARSDVILVGSGTVLADDSSLTCRLTGLESRSPSRVILDASGMLTTDHVVVKSAKQTQTTLVIDPQSPQTWRDEMQQLGCKVMPGEINKGRIALPELLDDLSAQGMSSIFVEGGAAVAESFLKEGLVDAIELFVGPNNIGAKSKHAIVAPITPQNVPKQFQLNSKLVFAHGDAKDVLYRYERID